MRAANDGDDSPVRHLPPSIEVYIEPLRKCILIVEPTCTSTAIGIEPLLPGLLAILPCHCRLSAFLTRLLPLLKTSMNAAKFTSTAPSRDRVTAGIMYQYLTPFLQILQPRLLSIRGYFMQLSSFFTELPSFLAESHQMLMLLQPMYATLASFMKKSAASACPPFFVMHTQLLAFLTSTARVLVACHPVMKQLHPLLITLTHFLRDLQTLLASTQELLNIIRPYQTLPLEARKKPVAPAPPPKVDKKMSVIDKMKFDTKRKELRAAAAKAVE
jgi:hypothetical protein